MAYLDYSPVQLLDTTSGMRELGDTLTAVAKRKQERDQFQQKLAFEREQEQRRLAQQQGQLDYQNKIESRKEKMGELDFNRRQQIDEDARMDRARKAATPQEAEAIVKGIRRYDPHTGKEIGQGKLTPGELPDVGPAPQPVPAPDLPAPEAVIPRIAQALPGMPPELGAMMRGKQKAQGAIPLDQLGSELPDAMPARQAEMAGQAERHKGKMFVDQIDDQGIATLITDEGEKVHVRAKQGWQEGALIGPDGQVTRAEGAEGSMHRFDPSVQGSRFEAGPDEYDQYEAAQAAHEADAKTFPQRSAEYEKKARDAESRRPYTMAVGDEPGVTFDFNTQRHGKAMQDAQDFVDTVGQLQLTPAQQEAAKFARLAIVNGADKDKVFQQFQQERITGIKQDYGHAEGLLRDKNRIDVAKIPRPGIQLSERRFAASQDKDIRKETREDIKQWLKANGFEAAPKQRAMMDQSIRQLKGNNKEVQAALVMMGRATQGDNRFSDQDYKVFVQNGGVGALDSAENTIQKLIDGGYGDETKRVATQMATAMRAVFKDRLDRAAAEGRDEFVHNEAYDPQIAESVLEQRLGRDVYVRESSRGGARGGEPPEIGAKRRGKQGSSIKIKAPTVEDAKSLRDAMQ